MRIYFNLGMFGPGRAGLLICVKDIIEAAL